MTITELQAIIDQNAESAEGGCPKAQGIVVNAQADIVCLRWESHLRNWSVDDEAWRSEERNWGVEPDNA